MPLIAKDIGRGQVSSTDKAKNKGQEVGGKAKETLGNVTGDKSIQDEGRSDQAKSHLKDAGEKVKDALNRLLGRTRR